MSAVQLNILEAIQEADKGIERAISKADKDDPGWSRRALDLLKEFLRQHVGPFMVEELRSYAAVVDFPLPKNARAWGGVIRSAAFRGIVENCGMEKTSNVKAHRTPANVWQAKK